jgi:hypothetical protein
MNCLGLAKTVVAGVVISLVASTAPSFVEQTAIVDFVDPTHGGRVRQLAKPDGQEHNIYSTRNAFNADNTYMVGIQSDANGKHWQLILYDGDGVFIKHLDAGWNWRIAWDRNDRAIFYVQRGARQLFKYNVQTGKLDLLKEFAPGTSFKPGDLPSLNQASDRILVYVVDKGVNRVYSYRLVDMGDEKSFVVSAMVPGGISVAGGNVQYIGYKNYVGIAFHDAAGGGVVIYNEDTQSVLHTFRGVQYKHFDYSPNGKLAYRSWNGGIYATRFGGSDHRNLEIHTVNIDGTNDQILYSATEAEAWWVQNLHISWPDGVNDWFLVGFYPPAGLGLPSTYKAPYDEILQVHTNGTAKFLARTGTISKGPPVQGWAQPLPSPSADGRKVSFNSICDRKNNVGKLGCRDTGTIDQYILYIAGTPR